jgi:uncharacterized protein YndB with AHSA1/START domain
LTYISLRRYLSPVPGLPLLRLRRFWNQRLAALGTELARGRRERARSAVPDHDRSRAKGQPMIDIASRLDPTRREVRRDEETVALIMFREYDAAVEDVWDAMTDPDRLRRWFLPVTGDLRVGGQFQTEGNAGGEILACDAPRLLRVTFGDASSILELRLAASGEEKTALELEHTVPLAMAGSGAGALYPGPGWDPALVTLAMHLADPAAETAGIADGSPEAIELARLSIEAWVATIEASDTATAEEIAAAREMAIAQFATPAAD